jgi:hypothetical protein
MSNPYQPPTVDPQSPLAAADLASLPPLRQQIMVLRIIVASLAVGVVVFGVVAVSQNLGKQHGLGTHFDVISVFMLLFGVAVLIVGLVLPSLVFRQAKVAPQMAAQYAVHGPDAARALGVMGRIQTATIAGSAVFEGGAFANLFAYMTTAELLNLIMAGILLLGILARFPLPGACARRIEDELRRQNEEASLKPVAIDRPGRV